MHPPRFGLIAKHIAKFGTHSVLRVRLSKLIEAEDSPVVVKKELALALQ
jgi:hypothetical protein